MDVKASHKLLISFIAARVFSATSVNGNVLEMENVLEMAHRWLIQKKRKGFGVPRLQKQGIRQKQRETFVFFFFSWSVYYSVRVWGLLWWSSGSESACQ